MNNTKLFKTILAVAILGAVVLTGCKGDVHTYERHVEDVQQDTQTKVIVE